MTIRIEGCESELQFDSMKSYLQRCFPDAEIVEERELAPVIDLREYKLRRGRERVRRNLEAMGLTKTRGMIQSTPDEVS